MPGTGCPLWWNDYFFFAFFFFFFAGYLLSAWFSAWCHRVLLEHNVFGRERSEFAHSGQGTHGIGLTKKPARSGAVCPNRAGNVEEGVGLTPR